MYLSINSLLGSRYNQMKKLRVTIRKSFETTDFGYVYLYRDYWSMAADEKITDCFILNIILNLHNLDNYSIRRHIMRLANAKNEKKTNVLIKDFFLSL